MSAHGTRSRFNQGCSCQRCRDANSDYIAGWNASRLPKRELRALLAKHERHVSILRKELAGREGSRA